MNTLRSIRKFIDKFNYTIGEITKYFIIIILVCLLSETAFQFLFDQKITIVKDLGLQILCILVAFGGSYALLYNNHVKADVFYGNWSVRKKAISDIVTFIAFLIFVGAFIYSSGQMAIDSWVNNETSLTKFAIPTYIVKASIAIGGILLLLQGVSKLIHDIIALITGKSEDLQELYYS